jgi:hypothetical protein
MARRWLLAVCSLLRFCLNFEGIGYPIETDLPLSLQLWSLPDPPNLRQNLSSEHTAYSQSAANVPVPSFLHLNLRQP